jgi:hypothetical protein
MAPILRGETHVATRVDRIIRFNFESYGTVVYIETEWNTIMQMHSPIPFTSPLFSERELQTTIQQALTDGLTGQIQITFLFGKTETILAIKGQVRQVYIRNHRVPDRQWKTPIEQFGAGTLSIETMPVRALMFRQAIVESGLPVSPTGANTPQLSTMFDLARANPGPTLFRIHWEHAEALVLIAGGHIPIQHAVLLRPFETDEWNAVIQHISNWHEQQCQVTVYRGDIMNQAWLELHLNILLEWYCQNILNHYQQLTGAVMVRSILQGLSVLAENKGWGISTQNQRPSITAIFSSAAETGRIYKEILSAIKVRIEPIIGSSLTQYIMKQSTEPTRGVYKTIQETFGLLEDTK